MRIPGQTIAHLLQYAGNWWNYFNKHQSSIRPVVVENIVNMLSCGKTVRGAATYACENPVCNHWKLIPFTCKSRFCPSCGKKATAKWIQQQRETLPQTDWQHITFTMPNSLWRLFALNRPLLNKLSACAAGCVKKEAKRQQAIPAIFTALHTFGRDLKWNTHVHLSTTLGGLSLKKDQWIKMSFKKNTLMKAWRYHIINLLRQQYRDGTRILPESLAQLCPDANAFDRWLHRRQQKRWIIHFTKPSKSFHHCINYLGSYIKRPPIAQARLKHYDGKTVTFRFLNHKNKRYQSYQCTPEQFITRFIQHIPDKGFRLIRYYGLLANRIRTQSLQIVYELLKQAPKKSFQMTFRFLFKRELGDDPLCCCVCKQRLTLQKREIGLSPKQLKTHHQSLALMKPIRLPLGEIRLLAA